MVVVNEPEAIYEKTRWKSEENMKSFEDNITDISNCTIQFRPPTYFQYNILGVKPKIKLSALRGKISRLTEKEIDDQISNIRTEWDRNT